MSGTRDRVDIKMVMGRVFDRICVTVEVEFGNDVHVVIALL